jgi:hypothetical protein
LIPRGLILAISVGVIAGAIFGIVFITQKDTQQLEFGEGPSISIVTEKIDYQRGENIVINIINSGTVPLTFSDTTYGLKITGLDGRILYDPIGAQVISKLEPKEERSFVWDQIKNDGDAILYGTYKITSEALDDSDSKVKKSITINILK